MSSKFWIYVLEKVYTYTMTLNERYVVRATCPSTQACLSVRPIRYGQTSWIRRGTSAPFSRVNSRTTTSGVSGSKSRLLGYPNRRTAFLSERRRTTQTSVEYLEDVRDLWHVTSWKIQNCILNRLDSIKAIDENANKQIVDPTHPFWTRSRNADQSMRFPR